MKCRKCSESALVCEQCSFGHSLVEYRTLAGRKFQECVESKSHCEVFAEPGGCERCANGFEVVRSVEGTQVCLEDTNRHFYWYLGVFLLCMVLLMGFGACFLYRKYKKKKESIDNILSKLDLRSLKTMAQRIKRMKTGADASGNNGPSSTYRNLVLEDELDAKKRKEADSQKDFVGGSQPDLLGSFKNRPKHPAVEDAAGKAPEKGA